MSGWKEARAREAEEARLKQDTKKKPSLKEFEDGMAEDLKNVREVFRERAEKENKRFADVCDSDYYFVVCFSNKAQLQEFCDSVGLNSDEIYVDGREFAKRIKRTLSTPDTDFPKIQPFNKDYVDRARNKGR